MVPAGGSGKLRDDTTQIPDESTSTQRVVTAPADAALVDEQSELLAGEAEALLSGGLPDRDDRLADLNLRLALLAWDLSGDLDGAARYLELAERHPLALRLGLSQALTAGTVDALQSVQRTVESLTGADRVAERAALLRDVAEAWLYRLQQPGRAVAVASNAIEPGIAADLRDELGQLVVTALGADGEWGELANALAAAGGAAAQLEAAALRHDRLADFTAAAELAQAAASAPGEIGLTASALAVELSARAGDTSIEIGRLLQRRLALLGEDVGALREVQATRYLLATHHAEIGELEASAQALAKLAAAGDGEAGQWGGRLAALGHLRVAIVREDWPAVTAQYRDLAGAGIGKLSSQAYRRRAAQLVDARLDDAGKALELWRQVHAASPDRESERAVERLIPASDHAGLIAHFDALARRDKKRAGVALRRAAHLAEARGKDAAAAIRLRRTALAGDPGVPGGNEELVRLLRGAGDRGKMAEAYRDLAATFGGDDPRTDRIACVYLWISGLLDLTRSGRERQAEEALTLAARRGPRDLAARGALAVLFRRSGRSRELAGILAELAALCSNPVSRYDVLRELGDVCGNVLGDGARARAALEEALALRPDDTDVMHGLARLYDQARDWAKAIELRRRAAESMTERPRAAALWLEVGQLEEGQRSDDAAALAAFVRASELDPKSIAALQAVARLHRKAQRHGPLIEVLRRERALTTAADKLLPMCLEIAQLSQQLGEPIDQVIAAWRDALGADRRNDTALRGLESAAGSAGRWDVVVETFQAAPETPANLRALANALSRREQWAELAEVQGKLIGALGGKGERGELCRAQAEVYELRLGNAEAAIGSWQRALQTDPSDVVAQRSLVRLLEAGGRWRDLAVALERELTTVQANDVERQVALLLRLGELRRTHLARPVDAAHAFEAVLERRPRLTVALDALEGLYDQLKRPKDLLRVIELRVDATERPADRAALAARVASIKELAGDIDGAIAALTQAVAASPDSRELFTQLEALCYRNERWAPVMQLYAAVIQRVEANASRAFRLADLYLRRGQVQAQYLGDPLEAIRSFNHVLELEPDNDDAMTQLETLLASRDDWRTLIAAYESRAGATRDVPRRVASFRAAAQIAASRLGNEAEAARLYGLLLKSAAGDLEALGFLEKHHERAGHWEQLVEVLRARVAVTPAGPEQTALLLRIGQVGEEGLHDDDRAIEHYQRVLDGQPEHKQALDALSRIYESTERWADFVDITRRQIKLTSDRNVKALLYFKCGSVTEAKFAKEDEAIRYYDAAIKTSPACLPAVHGLRDLHLRRRDWPRVIHTLELEVKLWQDDKERAGVFAQIGRIYGEELGDPERALHYYESALAVDPDCVPANKALFEQFYAAEEWQRALPLAHALAQRAMRDGDPETRSEFFRKRGVIAWKTGDVRGAAESIVIALEIKPTHFEALEALGQVARAQPDAYDYASTYRELEKIYRKRDDAGPLMARVLVAQAGFLERDGDLDAADKLYAEAAEKSPGDFVIVSAQVDLHVAMRRFDHAIEAIKRYLDGDPPPPRDVRNRALMRQAEIHADYEMEPHKAIRLLSEVIRTDESVAEAYYLMAQEYYSLGRFNEARAAIERVIELQAAPGAEGLSPERLARYYYYLGRIIEASGDGRAAASQYRRAAEYDPGYAPPALALAMRTLDTGDQQAAETLLIDAAHAAMAAGGEQAAVPLQRGLARILLAGRDRAAAIEAYRGILAVDPDNADDRLALAEIYSQDDLPHAIEEAKQVVEHDLRHAPAYRLLASYYARAGEHDRSARVSSAMESLGFAEDADRRSAALAEQSRLALRLPLTDELRRRHLLTRAVTSPYGELLDAGAAEFASLFPEPPVGHNLTPAQEHPDPTLRAAMIDTARLFGIEPEIYLGDQVPRGVVAIGFPRQVIVLDRELMGETDAARRFALGWAFETLVGRYSLLPMLGRRHRLELGSLVRSLFVSESARPQITSEFAARLPRTAHRVMERYQGMRHTLEIDEWIDGTVASARRAGLLACDDFPAALRVSARLNGESLGVGPQAIAALGVVICGSDLVRFYLSDEYHGLRDRLSRSRPGPA